MSKKNKIINAKRMKKCKHFTLAELECECNKYCDGNPAILDKYLISNLDQMREHFGESITVTCGMRCKKYNASLVGSIPGSKHTKGKAADIYIPGVSRAAIKRYWMSLPHANYCYYGTPNMGNAVHVDVR